MSAEKTTIATDTKPAPPGAGGDPAAAAAAAAAAKPANGSAGGDPAGPSIYKPEGLPDHFVGKDNNETIDKLYKAYDGSRKEIAKKNGVPEKIDDYKIDLPQELSSQVIKAGEDGKDPIFEALRMAAYKNNVSPSAAAAIATELYTAVAGNVAEATKAQTTLLENMDAEYKTYGGKEKAQPVIAANTAWLNGLKTKGVLDDSDVAELTTALAYGTGLRALDKIRMNVGGEKSIPSSLGAQAAGDQKTEKELKAMMQDPKYWRDKDPAFIEQITQGFQELYGAAA